MHWDYLQNKILDVTSPLPYSITHNLFISNSRTQHTKQDDRLHVSAY